MSFNFNSANFSGLHLHDGKVLTGTLFHFKPVTDRHSNHVISVTNHEVHDPGHVSCYTPIIDGQYDLVGWACTTIATDI